MSLLAIPCIPYKFDLSMCMVQWMWFSYKNTLQVPPRLVGVINEDHFQMMVLISLMFL